MNLSEKNESEQYTCKDCDYCLNNYKNYKGKIYCVMLNRYYYQEHMCCYFERYDQNFDKIQQEERQIETPSA